MSSIFIQEFCSFTKASDLLSNDAFTQALNALRVYCTKRFNAEFWELLEPNYDRNGKVLLRMIWDTHNAGDSSFIYDGNNEVQGQSAYCYTHKAPMWITGKDDGKLSESNDYVDQWTGKIGIPKYIEYHRNQCKTKTSILLPILVNSSVYVLNIETSDCLRISQTIKEELNILSKSLSDVIIKNQVFRINLTGTNQSVSRLSSIAEKELQYGSNKVFFACSSKASSDVVATTRRILDEFDPKLDVYFWKDSQESGDINHELITRLGAAQIGVCYLSEPPTNGGGYVDNPNVLFEAGFFHASVNSIDSGTLAWIPIREITSPPTPFDFSSERAVHIKRSQDGVMNTEALEYDLVGCLNACLNKVK